MVQVVLSLEEKYDKKLRRLARKIHGSERGGMSTVVERGIDMVEEEIGILDARAKLLEKIKNAKPIGVGTFLREEAYA